ncbi:Manganese transport system membrane protein MntB [compost metagenome]
MFFIVVSVVVGIQAVGVVLVAALLITPAVSARYWTDRLGVMVIMSGLFGALAGVVGTWLSSTTASLPTGPISVLASTLLFVVSLLFGPRRGLLAKRLTRSRARQTLREEQNRRVRDLVKEGGSL